jgi:diguanylate cyclase (GGDEF)-like protein
MGQYWEKATQLYDKHPRWIAASAGTAVLIGLTALHAALSYTSAFRALYVLPIWLATRMGGRISGLVLVVFSTLAGTLSEWQLGHAPGETIGSNFVLRFIALGGLMMLIAQVELALQKHQKMSLKDPLTGLLNRHALREFGRHAFTRALIRHQQVTVVVIDCDNFKHLNDTYGHHAGDQVLTLLARCLESETRQTDVLARTGGDEFAVVLQNTQLDEARQIMYRVDRTFVRSARDIGYEAGLSIGYGTTEGALSELEAVLELADRSMYEHKQAKKTGAYLR